MAHEAEGGHHETSGGGGKRAGQIEKLALGIVGGEAAADVGWENGLKLPADAVQVVPDIVATGKPGKPAGGGIEHR